MDLTSLLIAASPPVPFWGMLSKDMEEKDCVMYARGPHRWQCVMLEEEEVGGRRNMWVETRTTPDDASQLLIKINS